MSDYTPSELEVRLAYGFQRPSESDAEFDRFIASVKAEAWEEGQIVGVARAYIGRYDQFDTGSLMFRDCPKNPHIEKRKEES